MNLNHIFSKKIPKKDSTLIDEKDRLFFTSSDKTFILIPKIKWVEDFICENFEVETIKKIPEHKFTTNNICNTNTKVLAELFNIFGDSKDIDIKVSDKGLLHVESDDLIYIKTPYMR